MNLLSNIRDRQPMVRASVTERWAQPKTGNMILFDVGKGATFEDVNYDVLEKIKNGRIVANKYNSAELKIQTPNIVIVFSNDKPEVKKVSYG